MNTKLERVHLNFVKALEKFKKKNDIDTIVGATKELARLLERNEIERRTVLKGIKF